MSETQIPYAEQDYRDNLTAEIVAESQDLGVYTYNDAETTGSGWERIGDQALRSANQDPMESVFKNLHTNNEELHVLILPAKEEDAENTVMFRYGYADQSFKTNGGQRPGNELVVGFSLPESRANQLLDAVNADPDYINQLVRAQVEKSGALDKISVSWAADSMPNITGGMTPKDERSLTVQYHDLDSLQDHERKKAEAYHYGAAQPPAYEPMVQDKLAYSEARSVLPGTSSEWDILDPAKQPLDETAIQPDPTAELPATPATEQVPDSYLEDRVFDKAAVLEQVANSEAEGEPLGDLLDGLSREAAWFDAELKKAIETGDQAQAAGHANARDAYKAVYVEQYAKGIQDQENPRKFMQELADEAALAMVQSEGNEEAYEFATAHFLMTTELLTSATNNPAEVNEVMTRAYTKAQAGKHAGELALAA